MQNHLNFQQSYNKAVRKYSRQKTSKISRIWN